MISLSLHKDTTKTFPKIYKQIKHSTLSKSLFRAGRVYSVVK